MKRQDAAMELNRLRRTRHAVLWTALILVVAATLRFWALGEKSLWLDEIMTIDKAGGSFTAMMEKIRSHDAHPPLFQIVEWLWLRTGTSDAWARVPAALAGVLGVWLSMRIARRLFGRRAMYAAGVLMALSAFHVFYSQEARLQTLVTALFLAQVCLLLRIVDCRGRAGWKLWGAYGLVGLMSLYTYALSILTIGALAVLYLWLTRRHKPQWAHWLIVHAAIGLLFLPWVPTMHERTTMLEASIRQHGDAVGRPTCAELAEGVTAWVAGPHPFGSVRARAVCGAVFVLAALAVLLARRTRRPAKLFAALFVLPLIGYLVLPMPRVHQYEAKHLMFLQPILLIALAGIRPSVRQAGRAFRLPAVLMALALAAPNAWSLDFYYDRAYEKENWHGLCADVVPRLEGADLVLFNPNYVGFAFDYYSDVPNGKAGAEGLRPGVKIDPRYRRIWLIEGRSPVERPVERVPGILAAAGWQETESRAYPGVVGDVKWTLYVR